MTTEQLIHECVRLLRIGLKLCQTEEQRIETWKAHEAAMLAIAKTHTERAGK